MKSLLLILLVFALVASAADISGTWKGTADTPNGPIERTFVFHVSGDKLTGETSSEMMGKSEILNGKVQGDTVTFSIKVNFQGNDATLNYKGKIAGDQIKFDVEIPGVDQSFQYIAKKVS